MSEEPVGVSDAERAMADHLSPEGIRCGSSVGVSDEAVERVAAKLYPDLWAPDNLIPEVLRNSGRWQRRHDVRAALETALPLLGTRPQPQPQPQPQPTLPGQMLDEFHRRPGSDCAQPDTPTTDTPGLDQRVGFIEEEVTELRDGIDAGDVVAVADALADITYAVYGTAWRCAIPLDRVLLEVHRSNMTKTPAPGDGKAVKGPGYSPPDITGALEGTSLPAVRPLPTREQIAEAAHAETEAHEWMGDACWGSCQQRYLNQADAIGRL